MASVAHLLNDAENIITVIENRLAAAEKKAIVNYNYARLIQKIFRGYITRKHVELMHQNATCIQKNWRAFTGRIVYRVQLKEKFNEICWAYYNAMATVIQKCWRGHWIRSQVFSYYRLKAWLGFVMQQNELLRCSVEATRNNKNIAEMKQREDEAKEWIVYILFKLHHLLRTHQLSGIYSLPNTTELSEIEKMLKSLKYKDFMIFYNSYMEDVRRAKIKEMPSSIFPPSKLPKHNRKSKNFSVLHVRESKNEKKSYQALLEAKRSDTSAATQSITVTEGEYIHFVEKKPELDEINFCCDYFKKKVNNKKKNC